MKLKNAPERVRKVYKAKYKDGKNIPSDAIILVGMSMITQPKLRGRKLDAVADLFHDSLAHDKFVYLGDGLQIFNAAADLLIATVAQKSKGKLPENRIIGRQHFLSPELFADRQQQIGKDWIGNNAAKFCDDDDSSKTILRHSVIRGSNRFKMHLQQIIQWYIDDDIPASAGLCKYVSITVEKYLQRNHINLKGSRCTYDGEPVLEDDALSQAIKKYVHFKTGNLEKYGKNTSHLENPIYLQLLKYAFSYVFEELAGFRAAAEAIKDRLPMQRKDNPFCFIYPGNLSVINAYFELIPPAEVKMVVKEIEIESKTIRATNRDSHSPALSDESSQSSSPLSISPEMMMAFLMKVDQKMDQMVELRAQAPEEKVTPSLSHEVGEPSDSPPLSPDMSESDSDSESQYRPSRELKRSASAGNFVGEFFERRCKKRDAHPEKPVGSAVVDQSQRHTK